MLIPWESYEVRGGEISYTPHGQAITTPDLVDGALVHFQSLYGYTAMKIVKNESSYHLESPDGYWIGFLEFAEDDRKCWACIGAGNVKAIQKVSQG